MRKMITISLARRADIVNLDSCCLYTNREVANSAAALSLLLLNIIMQLLILQMHNNY